MYFLVSNCQFSLYSPVKNNHIKLCLVAVTAILFISSGFLVKDNDSIDNKLEDLLNDKFDEKIQEELHADRLNKYKIQYLNKTIIK